MKDVDRRQLGDSFALPKVAVTKTSLLDAVVSTQCLKNTKLLGKPWLAFRLFAPLTELLELRGGDNIRPGGLCSGVCHHPPE